MLILESHLSQVRGLKYNIDLFHKVSEIPVAPFTGAWIEIAIFCSAKGMISSVAPFSGAWIEI